MAFLGRLLRYLGILGLPVILLQIYRNDTIDTDEYKPFCGLLCFI
jgi:hypothetical protein